MDGPETGLLTRDFEECRKFFEKMLNVFRKSEKEDGLSPPEN